MSRPRIEEMDKKETKEKIREMYQEEHKSCKQIAKHFDCSYMTIYRRLKNMDVEIRDRSR